MSENNEPEVVTPEAGASEEPTFEQYPEDHPLVKTLAKQKAELKAERARAAELTEKARRLDEMEEASKSELQKAQERAEAAERALEQTRLESVRTEVALAKGLTTSQAKRLVGDSREALEADADDLLSDLKVQRPASTPSADGQGRTGTAVGTSDKQLTRADLQNMSPEKVNEARRAGLLKDIINGS